MTRIILTKTSSVTRDEMWEPSWPVSVRALCWQVQHAASTVEHDVAIKTGDGECDAFFVTPENGRMRVS
ncbi:MAG: hypothetical protein R3C53_12440 [Pirellulaceae bacterium]